VWLAGLAGEAVAHRPALIVGRLHHEIEARQQAVGNFEALLRVGLQPFDGCCGQVLGHWCYSTPEADFMLP
jgi:hypothetical protein